MQVLTKNVGDNESITGNNFFIGFGNSPLPSEDGICTAKTVSDLGGIYGSCPEGPTLKGGFGIAGIAHWARNNRIRKGSDINVPATDTRSLKVATYGIVLASSTPQIRIPIGATGKSVTIVPTSRMKGISARRPAVRRRKDHELRGDQAGRDQRKLLRQL